ncbi:hypothetical protein PpBr36_07554, partial [Pyricularia pennisetigena]|uniref:hypothetical protein n=1 Tax=Pyricularia pennisetigena TaxID=1578925 RepID=UPI00114E5BDA
LGKKKGMPTEGGPRASSPDSPDVRRPFSITAHDEALLSEAARHAKMAALEITSTFDTTPGSSGCASSSGATAGRQSSTRPTSCTGSGGIMDTASTAEQEPAGAALRDALTTTIAPEQPRHETRKLANPTPLGLCAFALTTFALSCINVNAGGVRAPHMAVPLALGYGGLVQLLAGMWEMAAGNTFSATALSSYGGFWLAYGILLTPGFGVLGPGGAYDDGSGDASATARAALGIFLAGWFVFSVVLTLLTLRSHLALLAMFLALDLTFLMLAVAEFAGSDGAVEAAAALTRAGGAFGLVTAFLAWYNAFAGLVDDSNFFCTIPVYHFPWSEKAKGVRNGQKTEREMV